MLPYPKRILLVKNRALGDSVMGLSSVQYLREYFPEAEIVYALPHWIIPLYQNQSDTKLTFMGIDTKSLNGQFDFFKKIITGHFDLALELNQSGSSGKILKLASFLTGLPYFFHNHHDKSGQFVIDQGKIKPNIQRDLDLIFSVLKKIYKKDIGAPNYLHYPPKLKVSNQSTSKKFAIFGVVATRDTKCWPINYYLDLAQLLLSSKTVEEILIPLSNSAKDQEIEKQITSSNLTGVRVIKQPLNNLLGSLERAQFYIGNDTGLKHIAVALGIKTFTFFGPEDPLEWHPYSKEMHPYFFRENLACRTQLAHFCPLATCDSMICLNEYLPSDIYQQITRSI